MTDLTTPRAPERPAPEPDRSDQPVEPPGQPAGPPEQRAAPPEQLGARPGRRPTPLPGIVELDRLLALSRLTTPQALEIGAGLLAAVAGRAAEEEVPRTVVPVLLADGRVALGPAAGARSGRPVARVLEDVGAAARRPGAAGSPGADGRLEEIDRAVAALDGADREGSDGPDGVTVGPAAGRLRLAVAGIDRLRVRGEIAALGRAVGALPGGSAGAVGPRPLPAPVGARPAARPARPPRRPRSAARRIGAWLLSLAVLGGVVAAEVVVLGDDITTDIDLLLDAGRSGEEAPAEPEPDGLPVVAPAPPSAGSVTAVDLRPLAQCAPGGPCAVRLLVRLLPSPEPQVVTWSYRVVDRCTGASTTVPGGSVPVPPQAERTAVVAEVPLPPLAGVALLAVTEAPAIAASAPVTAGTCLPAGPDQ